jgi:hypothetical protein
LLPRTEIDDDAVAFNEHEERHGSSAWRVCVVVVMPGTSLVAFTAAGGHCDVGDDYGINTGARLHQQRSQ